MWRAIRKFLRNSSRVHVREPGPTNYRELVDLLDRFIDDEMRYPLEWDDFISWEHQNPNIEAVRNRIAAWEPLAFGSATERDRFFELFVSVRNECAALVGIAVRIGDST
jgi:hypothetical protein